MRAIQREGKHSRGPDRSFYMYTAIAFADYVKNTVPYTVGKTLEKRLEAADVVRRMMLAFIFERGYPELSMKDLTPNEVAAINGWRGSRYDNLTKRWVERETFQEEFDGIYRLAMEYILENRWQQADAEQPEVPVVPPRPTVPWVAFQPRFPELFRG